MYQPFFIYSVNFVFSPEESVNYVHQGTLIVNKEHMKTKGKKAIIINININIPS